MSSFRPFSGKRFRLDGDVEATIVEDSDGESDATLALPGEQKDKLEIFAVDLEDIKTVCSGWFLAIPAHRYTLAIRVTITEFISEVTLALSRITEIIGNHTLAESMHDIDELVDNTKAEWNKHKESVVPFLSVPDEIVDDVEDSDVEVSSQSKKPRH